MKPSEELAALLKAHPIICIALTDMTIAEYRRLMNLVRNRLLEHVNDELICISYKKLK
jgi:hypothetical protein